MHLHAPLDWSDLIMRTLLHFYEPGHPYYCGSEVQQRRDFDAVRYLASDAQLTRYLTEHPHLDGEAR